MTYTMALNETAVKALLNRLDAIQKEINEIHQQLLFELDNDNELTAAETAEIKDIIKQNDFRTFDEWEKEKPLD